MQKHPTHKSAKGFTLIELVIAVAIIGILTSVAILGYNQYKVRAYDAHSKQALRDILLQCNAFWLDQDASKVCNHATVAEVYVASDEIVLKFPAEDLPDLPGGSQGNFCASAQHVSSPNTYSIDSASLISDTEDCGGAGGSAPKLPIIEAQTFETYNSTVATAECEKYSQIDERWPSNHPHQRGGTFARVNSEGAIVPVAPIPYPFAHISNDSSDGMGGCGRSAYTWRQPCITQARCSDADRLAAVDFCKESFVQGGELRGWGSPPSPSEEIGWSEKGREKCQVSRGEFRAVYVGRSGSELAAMLPGWHYVYEELPPERCAGGVEVWGPGGRLEGQCRSSSFAWTTIGDGEYGKKGEGTSLFSRIRYNFETKMWTDPKTGATFKGGERVE